MDSLSYLGGVVTGEGSFCLAVYKRKGKDNYRITPVFAIFMSDRETVNTIAGFFAELGLPVYMQERPKAARDQVGIHIGGFKRVRRYCEVLLPVLTGQKKRAAEIVLAFIQSRESRSKFDPYTEYELDLVRELRAVNGNTRGKKTPL